jgi:hypothetical protein
MLQDRHQQHGDRLAEVQHLRRASEDLAGVAGVGVNVLGSPGRVAGEQRPGMNENDRVIVDVDDPAPRRHRLSHLVRVIRRRNAGADVQELPDPCLCGQEPHHARLVGPVGASRLRDGGESSYRLVSGGPVSGEIILPAQPIVVDTSDMRNAGIERHRLFAHCRVPFRTPA